MVAPEALSLPLSCSSHFYFLTFSLAAPYKQASTSLLTATVLTSKTREDPSLFPILNNATAAVRPSQIGVPAGTELVRACGSCTGSLPAQREPTTTIAGHGQPLTYLPNNRPWTNATNLTLCARDKSEKMQSQVKRNLAILCSSLIVRWLGCGGTWRSLRTLGRASDFYLP